MAKSGITIDLIIKGMESLDKLSKLLTALATSSKVQAGFVAIYRALQSVSQGLANVFLGSGKVFAALSRAAQNPAVQLGFKKIALVLRVIQDALKGTENEADKAKAAFVRFSFGVNILAIQLRSLSFMLRDISKKFFDFAKAIASAFVLIAKTGAGIEFTMSELQAILGETSKTTPGFSALSDEIIRVGKSSSFTSQEVAELAVELAKAGFSTAEVTVALENVVQLAEAGAVSASRAAEIASNVLRSFQLRAEELGRVNDILVATASYTNTTVESLGYSFSYVAPIAEAYGQSLEEVAGALGVLANAGIKGSSAGAGLAQVFSQLASRGDKADAILKKYGSSFEAVNPLTNSLVETMREFERVQLSAADATELFGDRARRSFLVLQNMGVAALETMVKLNLESAGLAASIAEIRMDNLMGDFLRFKSAVEALAFGAFQAISDNLRSILQYLTEIINKAAEWVKSNESTVAWIGEAAIALAAASASAGVLFAALHSITLVAATILTAVGAISQALIGLGIFSAAGGGLFGAAGVAAASAISAAITSMAVTLGWIAVIMAGIVAAFTAIAWVATEVIVRAWKSIYEIALLWYQKVVLPALKAMYAGFMSVYKNVISPMFNAVAMLLEYIIAQLKRIILTPEFQRGVEVINYLFGQLLGVIAAIVAFLGSVVFASVLATFGLMAEVVGNLVQLIGWLTGGFSELGNVAVPAAEQIALAMQDVENKIHDTTMALLQFTKEVGLMQNIGGNLSRLFELDANQRANLAENLQQAINMGLDLSVSGVNAKLQSMRNQINSVVDDLVLGEREEGSDPEENAKIQAAKKAHSANTDLYNDLKKQYENLLLVKDDLANLSKARAFADFDDLTKEKDRAVQEIESLGLQQAAIRREIQANENQRDVIGDEEYKKRREALQSQLDTTEKQSEATLKWQSLIQGITTEEEFLALAKSKTFHEVLAALDAEDARAAAALKAVEMQEELNTLLEQANDLQRELDNRNLTGVDKDLADVEATYEKRAEVLEAAIDSLSEKISVAGGPISKEDMAALADLQRLETDMERARKEEIQKINQEHSDSVNDILLDANLDRAKQDKNMQEEIRLEMEKFNAETDEIVKRDFQNKAAEAKAYEDLRKKQAADMVADIQARYAKEAADASKKPVDRSKELVETQNKSLQILLEKVQSTRDLVNLELALMRIQKMRDLEAIQQIKKTVAAEAALRRAQAKLAEGVAGGATGEKLGKLQDEVKKRGGIADLRAGAMNRAKATAGVDTTNPSALAQAQVGLDLTTAGIVNKIQTAIATVSIALVDLNAKFSAAGVAWIDSFIASWQANFPRLANTIQNSFNGIGVPGPNVAGGGNNNNVNFNINNRVDQQEFVRVSSKILMGIM